MDEREPIGSGLAFALIAFGIMIDLVQLLLTFLMVGFVLNPVLDLFAMGVFWIMLYHHGQKVLSRRGMSFGFSALIELIPGLDAIPVWTVFAIYTVVKDHSEALSEGMEDDPDNNPGPPTRSTWSRVL
jgi:hypothetical protein